MKKLAQVKKARPSNLVGSDPASQVGESPMLRAGLLKRESNGKEKGGWAVKRGGDGEGAWGGDGWGSSRRMARGKERSRAKRKQSRGHALSLGTSRAHHTATAHARERLHPRPRYDCRRALPGQRQRALPDVDEAGGGVRVPRARHDASVT